MESDHISGPLAGTTALYKDASEVVALCLEHSHRIREGRPEMRSFMDRLFQLQNALSQLSNLIEDGPIGSSRRIAYIGFYFGRQSEIVQTCRESIAASLQKLQRAFLPGSTLARIHKSVTWPLTVGDLRRLSDHMRPLEEGIARAITVDADKLPTGTTATLRRTVGLSKEVHRMQQEGLRRQREIEKDTMRKSFILSWLRHPDPFTAHNIACTNRNDNIKPGSWLIDGVEFQRFQTEKRGMLWLHGSSGAGKSVLSSIVIDHLCKSARGDPSTIVAFWYFDSTDRSRTRADSFLRALICQIIANPDVKVPRALADLWISKLRGRRVPRVAELLAILPQVLMEVKNRTVHIVLDALDECHESDLDSIFGLLRSLLSDEFGSIHIFSTTRLQEGFRIESSALPFLQSVPIGDRSQPDIVAHISDTLCNNRVLNKWPQKQLERIKDALLTNCRGNFRWVECQLRDVRVCKRQNDLDHSLRSLPRDMNDQYEHELSSIPDSDAKDALRLIEWMAFARRPLQIREAAEVLAVNLNRDSLCFDPGNRTLNPLQGLASSRNMFQNVGSDALNDLVVDSLRVETLTFANKSVLDYIESQSLRIGSRVSEELTSGRMNLNMAETCLVYLQYHSTLPLNLPTGSSEDYPFASYCAKYWNEHYREALHNRGGLDFSVIDEMIIDLLDTPERLFAYIQLFDPDGECHEGDSPKNEAALKEPLYYAALLGLKDAVEYFLDEGADVNKLHQSAYGTSLIAAVANGHIDIVRMLLRAGADAALPCEEYGYPLAVAIEQDEREMVDLLMHQKGVDIDCQRMPPRMIAERKASAAQSQLEISNIGNDQTQGAYLANKDSFDVTDLINEAKAREGMVYVAVEHRALRTLALLLDTGADPNIEGGSCHTALILAVAQGDEKVIDMLLQHEAQADASGGMLGNVVGAACLSRKNSGLLKKFLTHKVDVNMPLSTGETPLCIAAKNNDLESVNMLLTHGADASTNQERPISPLEIAARNGYLEVARKLIESGASVNSQGVEYSTMLHAACTSHDTKMVHLLLDHGADANHAPDNDHATPLQFAASLGREDVVDVLLGRGANIMAPIGRFGNSMQAAVEGRNLAILEKFRMSGLSVNLRGGPFTYPLFRALELPSYDVVEWLLDHGADVNARNEDRSPYLRYRPTALHMCRNVSFARLLFERGIQPEIVTEDGIPPLSLAAEDGNVVLAAFLIEQGADTNGRSPEDESTPLIRASRRGHTDLAELLIQKGADVHYRNACGLNAMTVAVQSRQLKLLGVLFLHGAKGPTAVDARGVSDLHYAAASGKVEMLDYIVQSCNLDPSVRDANGWTALHWAVKSPWGSVKMIKKLLDLGVDKQFQDVQGRTPLDIAVSLGMKHEAEVLRARTEQEANAVREASDIDHDNMIETWWGYDTCNLCGSGRGDQYQCQQCPHYNLCFRCVLDQTVVHTSEHEFVCVLHDGDGFDHLNQNRAFDSASNVSEAHAVKGKIAPRLKTSSLRVSDAPLLSPSTPLELRWLDQRFRPDSHFSDGRVNSDSFGPPPVPRKDSYLLPSPKVEGLRSSDGPNNLLRISTGTSQSEYSEASEDAKAEPTKLDREEMESAQIAPRITACGPSDRTGNSEEIDPEEDHEPSYGPFGLRDDTSPRTTVGRLSNLPNGKSEGSRLTQFSSSLGSPLYSPRTVPPAFNDPKTAASRTAENATIPSHTSFLRPPSLHEDWPSSVSTHESREPNGAAESSGKMLVESEDTETEENLPRPLPKDSLHHGVAQPAGGPPPLMQQDADANTRTLPPGLLAGRPGVSKAAQPSATSSENVPAHAWENRRYSRMSIPPPPPPKPGKPFVPPAPPTAPAAEGRFPLHMYSVSAGTHAPLYTGNAGKAAGTPVPPSQLALSSIPQSAPQVLPSSTAPPKDALPPTPSSLPLSLQPRFPPTAPRPNDTFKQQSLPFPKPTGASSSHHGHSASVSRLPGALDHPSQPRTLAQLSQQQATHFLPPRQSSLDTDRQPAAPPPTLSQLQQQEIMALPHQPSRHSIGGLEVNPDFMPSPLSSRPTPLTGPLQPLGFGPSPLSGPSTSRYENRPDPQSVWRPSPFGDPGSYFPPRPSQESESKFPPRPSDASDMSYRQRPSEEPQASNIDYQQRPSEVSQMSDTSYQPRPSEASQISNTSFQPRPPQGSISQFSPRPSQGSELPIPHRPSQATEKQMPRRPPLEPSGDSESSSGSGSLGTVELPAEVSLGYGPDFSFENKSSSTKPAIDLQEQSTANEPQELEGDERTILGEGKKGRGNAWMADKRAGQHMKQNSRQERPADIKTMRTTETVQRVKPPPSEIQPRRGAESATLRSPEHRMRGGPSALEPATPPQGGRSASANASGGMAARLTAAAARAGTIAHAAAAAAAVRSPNGPESPRNASPSTSGKETPSRPSPPPTSAGRGPGSSGGKPSRNGAPSIPHAASMGRSGSPFDAGFDSPTLPGGMVANRRPADAVTAIPFGAGSVVTTITGGGPPKRGMWPGRDGRGAASFGGRGRAEPSKSSPRMYPSPRLAQGPVNSMGTGAGAGSPRLQQQEPMDLKAMDRAKWERGRVDYDRIYGGDSDDAF